jgi:tRNA dimethylallyltransferase
LGIGVLTGPTAAGKSALALQWARESPVPIELVNADSLLVYRGMDIGSAKPTPAERAEIPHHLIDLRDPNDPFTAADFAREALAAIDGIHARGARALVVGGTGFYLKGLIHGVWSAPPTDPKLREDLARVDSPALYRELLSVDEPAALRIGGHDRYRLVRAIEILRLSGKTPSQLQAEQSARAPDPRFRVWIVDREQAELELRIETRTRAMLAQGLLDEVRALRARYPDARPLGSVGYREALRHLSGEPAPGGRKPSPGLEGMIEEICLATRQLVKAQRTWFRGQTRGKEFLLDEEREALWAELRSLYSRGA